MSFFSKLAQPNFITSLVFFATLAGAPFPFGSVDRSTIAFWCIFLGIGLAAASPRQLRGGHVAILMSALVITAGYGFVLHEQLSDSPWIAQPHAIWAQASEVLKTPLTPSVSIARHEPFYAIGAPLAAMLSFICGLVIGADRRGAHRALDIIAVSGAIYAVVGFLYFVIEPGMLLWREKTAYLGSLTGTFINRNTAATYFGSCAIVSLVLLMEKVRHRLPSGVVSWTDVRERILYKASRSIIVMFSMLFLCLAALFLTGSRAGVVLTLMVLVVAFTIYFRRSLPSRTGVWITLVSGGAVALILLQFMGAGVSARFEAQGLLDEGRLEAYRSTLQMIGDYPWFGTGLGTFAVAFPPYRSDQISMWGVWDRAHSTPLEMAAELGLPLTTFVGLGWICALILLTRRLGGRHITIPLAALSVAVLAVLHSCIDFSLQIPGYALVATGLIGVGLAQSVTGIAQEPGRTSRLRMANPPGSD